MKIKLDPVQAPKSNFDGLRGVIIPFIPNSDTTALCKLSNSAEAKKPWWDFTADRPSQQQWGASCSTRGGRHPSPARKQTLPSSFLIQHHMNNSNIHIYLKWGNQNGLKAWKACSLSMNISLPKAWRKPSMHIIFPLPGLKILYYTVWSQTSPTTTSTKNMNV